MENRIVRNALAILGGAAVAIVVVMLVEMAGHLLFPAPEGLDITNPDDQARLMESIPLAAKIAVVVAWFLGALAGGITALKIGKTSLAAWMVGLLMVAASVVTTTMFPHPAWMVVGALALPLLAILTALKLTPDRP